MLPNDLAAVSVGLIDGDVHLDLDYILDSNADVDMNVIMTSDDRLVEIQGTGEEATFSIEEMHALTALDRAPGPSNDLRSPGPAHARCGVGHPTTPRGAKGLKQASEWLACYGSVAQLGERGTEDAEAVGSSPT